MTKNFLKILEGFQNDEFSLNCPNCQNDEKSGGSIMTKKLFVIMDVALINILE